MKLWYTDLMSSLEKAQQTLIPFFTAENVSTLCQLRYDEYIQLLRVLLQEAKEGRLTESRTEEWVQMVMNRSADLSRIFQERAGKTSKPAQAMEDMWSVANDIMDVLAPGELDDSELED